MKCLEDSLHVVTVVSNPVRFRTRYALYKDFAKRVSDGGATLTTVEVAFGERPFEVTERDNPRHLQLRTRHELWHKENALNLGINSLCNTDPDWRYVAWVDADVSFARSDWAAETVHQLQHFDVVQMWSHAQDLGPDFQPIQQHTGFVYSHVHGLLNGDAYNYCAQGHPGYAWAARREALDNLGGLIDYAILGAADKHMALGLIGRIDESVAATVRERGSLTPPYIRELLEWQARAEKHIRRNIGYVPGTLNHYWHGSKKLRKYVERWRVLINNGYDPDRDIKRDTQGLYQLTDRSIGLRDDIRAYFRQRSEDDIRVD